MSKINQRRRQHNKSGGGGGGGGGGVKFILFLRIDIYVVWLLNIICVGVFCSNFFDSLK